MFQKDEKQKVPKTLKVKRVKELPHLKFQIARHHNTTEQTFVTGQSESSLKISGAVKMA